MPPLISICLPNLNTRPFLEERMDTILAQTVTDWELIISDNYSDDGSWEFFQKFKGDPRIKMSQAPRRGMYANWNKCMQRATGQYIYIATSDDTAVPTLLERLLTPLQSHSELAVAVCDFEAIDEHSKPLQMPTRNTHWEFFGDWITIPSIRNGKTEFLLHTTFGCAWWTFTAVLFRRALLEHTGYFRTDLATADADKEWAMRASLASDIAFVPGKLATWRIHPTQATGHNSTPRQCIKSVLTCVNTVLRDKNAGIPSEWMNIHGWDQAIAHVWQTEYYDSFRLYRGDLQRQPQQFLRNAWSAVRTAPGFFLRQAFNGFAWSEEFSPNRPATARNLIALFHAPWPPQKMTGGW